VTCAHQYRIDDDQEYATGEEGNGRTHHALDVDLAAIEIRNGAREAVGLGEGADDL